MEKLGTLPQRALLVFYRASTCLVLLLLALVAMAMSVSTCTWLHAHAYKSAFCSGTEGTCNLNLLSILVELVWASGASVASVAGSTLAGCLLCHYPGTDCLELLQFLCIREFVSMICDACIAYRRWGGCGAGPSPVVVVVLVKHCCSQQVCSINRHDTDKITSTLVGPPLVLYRCDGHD
eukprot:2232866-Amphidinium_carterae.2